MLLAVIDPRDRSAFRVGIVDTVYDKFYFKIALLGETETLPLWDDYHYAF